MKRYIQQVLPFMLLPLLTFLVGFGIYGLTIAIRHYKPQTMALRVCEGRYCHGIQTPPGASPETLLQPQVDFSILGVPNHGKPLTIWADARDPFGSIVQCMEVVHAANFPKTIDAGYCEVPPIQHVGITRRLTRLYPDVYVKVRN